MKKSNTIVPLLVLVSSLLLAACNQAQAPAGQAPPPQVEVMPVHMQKLPLQRKLVGRLAPTQVAEVRARVTGIVQKRVYNEGSQVEQGQLLFVIDPAELKARLNEAQAALQQALAKAKNDQAKAKRAKQLAGSGVISKQALDDAIAASRASQAAVAQARAAVKSAELNLSYTKVEAPIAGRAGRALVTRGALVSQTAATQLTTIRQIDPMYVNFSQPLEIVTRWRKARASGEVEMGKNQKITVQLILPGGAEYDHTGVLNFTNMRVDPETGSVALRATMPNPELTLLPGMFVNVKLNAGTLTHVALVPQKAVLRNATGAYVLVVDDNNTVQQVPVQLRGARDGNWVIDQGLVEGQRIVVSGVQRARPGSKVEPVPVKAAPAGKAKAASDTSPDAASDTSPDAAPKTSPEAPPRSAPAPASSPAPAASTQATR